MTDSADRKGVGAALTTSIAWGMTGIFVRLLPAISPLLITASRLLVAFVLTVPVLLFFGQRRRAFRAALGHRASWWLSLLSVIYYMTAVAAYQLAPVGEVALLISTSPLFALAYSTVRRLLVPRREVVGATVAMLGVGIIVLPNLVGLGAGTAYRLLGDVLACLSAAAAAFYAIGFRTLSRRDAAPDSVGVSLLTFLLGAVLLFPWEILQGRLPELGLLDARDGLFLAGLGFFSTLIPTILYAVASQRLSPVLTTTIRLLIPVFAAVFAVLILGEIPSPWVLPGGACVLGGILYMVQRSELKVES